MLAVIGSSQSYRVRRSQPIQHTAYERRRGKAQQRHGLHTPPLPDLRQSHGIMMSLHPTPLRRSVQPASRRPPADPRTTSRSTTRYGPFHGDMCTIFGNAMIPFTEDTNNDRSSPTGRVGLKERDLIILGPGCRNACQAPGGTRRRPFSVWCADRLRNTQSRTWPGVPGHSRPGLAQAFDQELQDGPRMERRIGLR